MNFIQPSENNKCIDNNNKQIQIINSIKSVISELFQNQQFQLPNRVSQQYLTQQNYRSQQSQRIKHITLIQLKQIQYQVKLLWQFKILTHVLIIKISLLDQQPLAYQIKSLCRKLRQKVLYYFCHINNISFNQNQGQFYVHTDSKIIYQYRQDNWYALKNPFKLRYHLHKKLSKISHMFKTNIQNFLVKFKLVPNIQLQKQNIYKLQRLNQIKVFFQQNKKTPSYPPQMYQNMLHYRKNSTQIDLNKIFKFDKNILAITQGHFPAKLNKNIQNKQNPSFQQLRYQFKNKITQYNNFSQYNDILYPLVIAMQVIQVKNQTLLKDKGGFGKITRGLYSCKYGKTIYDDINRELQGQNYFSQQIFNRYLCKKSSLLQHCEAFQNQKEALMKLRNKKSPHIAQYYCNISKGKPFDDGSIYMDVYASNIDEIPIKIKHKFKIIMEIIKGLSFLNTNGILHRDMKPQNVVVDRQMNSKIIDFGSCCNVYQRQDLFKPFDSKLRSTNGYFVRYQTYQSTITNKKMPLLTKQQFYQHFFFDIYSYGKIIQRVFGLEQYAFVQQDFLMSQLYYLYKKCCQVNPADRLAHQEIQFFLQTLIKMEKQTLK